MELGRVSVKERDIVDLLAVYKISDERVRSSLLDLARQATTPGWWHQYSDVVPDWFHTYTGLEEAAARIRTYEAQFVPGLLQTEDYARAVITRGHLAASPEEAERRVSFRMARKQLLTRPEPPHLWAVIDESALRRPIGNRQILQNQLVQLMEIARWPNVTMQVTTFEAGGHAAEGGAFTMLRFPEPDVPDVIYVEQLTGALYLDKRDDVERYLDVMDQLGLDAEPPTATADVLGAICREI